MNGSFARRFAVVMAAFAVATSVFSTPASAAAASLTADQTAVLNPPQPIVLKRPDLQVTVWDAKWVNGTFKYFFYVKNVGSYQAEGVVLYKRVEIDKGLGFYVKTVETQYNVPTPIQPGQTLGVEVECPAGLDPYCAKGSLEAKVTKFPYDRDLTNNHAVNTTTSRD